MSNLRIWWDQDVEAYRLSNPYNQAFVDFFKSAYPVSDREWDPSSKMWTFVEKHLDSVVLLVEKIYKQKPVVISKQQAQRASTPPNVQALPINDVIASFVHMVPYEAMQKAYRHAALLMHPDRGGDMEQMSKMNAVWQRLEKELYKK